MTRRPGAIIDPQAMTPTQDAALITAQDREYAKDLWDDLGFENASDETIETIAQWFRKVRHEYALTAAAEPKSFTYCPECGRDDDLSERLAYSKGFNEGWERGRRPADSGLDAALVSLDRDKAIERCLEALEKVGTNKWGHMHKSDALAAIRAVKERP